VKINARLFLAFLFFIFFAVDRSKREKTSLELCQTVDKEKELLLKTPTQAYSLFSFHFKENCVRMQS